MIKIGLDLHGVIDAVPEFFSELTKVIVDSGNEVHIITGGSWKEENLEEDLKKMGIRWTHYFSVYDHLLESGTKIIGDVTFPDGKIQKRFENGHWDQCKGDYCKEHNISLHLDDTLIYNEYFQTPFARMCTHNGNHKKGHKSHRHLP
jgi:hypothetical protein